MDISIVIVEYWCADEVENCVNSIQKYLQNLDWECFVVSNSLYNEEELKSIKQRLPNVTIIRSERNSGYAGGVNQVLPVANAPYIFILNPDSLLTDNNVSGLLKIMEQDDSVAIVGPRVVDDKKIVQPSCRRFPRPWTFLMVRGPLRRFWGASKERQRYLMEDFDHRSAREADWVSGGAMLVRKSAIDDVGPMDERFFLYMEDVDWCRRFWRKGYKVYYFPECIIIHSGQHASIGSLRNFISKNARMHLGSMIKYFLKWLFSF